MEKHRNTFFLMLLFFTLATTAGLIFWSADKVSQGTKPVPSFASGTASKISETETPEEILSPNGKMTLILKTIKNSDRVTNTLFTKTEENKEPVQIYSTDSEKISIPFNTFSPNNKYIFLKIGDFEKPEYIVLRTDGKDMKDGKKTVEITDLFYEKYDDFVITDVTGWGGEGLIVVNTKSLDGETGPSFWFDLSGFSYIRLSTIFN